MDDLVIRNDLYYKKFTDVPFTGETQDYWVNGELWRKQYYKDEKADGLWERYSKDGSLEETRAYKNSERISCKGDCD
jgi:antitoxin component YwqK of YwqJK toxin-antitoxin module